MWRRRRLAAAAWQVEVDYGSGWVAYGPQYEDRYAAQLLARELGRHGHDVRLAPVDVEIINATRPDVVEALLSRVRAHTEPDRVRELLSRVGRSFFTPTDGD